MHFVRGSVAAGPPLAHGADRLTDGPQGQYAEHFYCTAGGYPDEGPPGFDTPDPDTYTFTCNGDSGSGLMKREGDAWEGEYMRPPRREERRTD